MPKLKRNTNWRRNEQSSQKKESAGKDMVPYPHVIVNCTVQLERLDPAMLETLQPQTQKKEVSSGNLNCTVQLEQLDPELLIQPQTQKKESVDQNLEIFKRRVRTSQKRIDGVQKKADERI